MYRGCQKPCCKKGLIMVTELKECRICKSIDLTRVLDLGSIYPSAFLNDNEKVSEDMKTPLSLCQCNKCGLVQLEDTIDLDLMYRQYWYASSLNKSMVSSLQEIVTEIENKVDLELRDVVVDIGCNDGTMLNLYKFPEKLIQIGYDPSLNLSRGDYHFKFINDYFNADTYVDSVGQPFPKAMVITSIAMLYDLPDPNKFIKDVVSILRDDGIFVVQFTDLLSMFKLTAFDNICHEHLEYYSLKVIKNLFKTNGLKLVDVSYNNVNGGSIRITSAHEDSSYKVSPSVNKALKEEIEYFDNGNTFTKFQYNIERAKEKFNGFLKWAKFQDKSVYMLGASTKSATLLQVCGITSEMIPFAAEVNQEKFGLRTVGSNIKIIPEEEALIKHPDYLIIPIWHFIDNLLTKPRIKDYLNSGGSLVVPLPELAVYTKNGKFIL